MRARLVLLAVLACPAAAPAAQVEYTEQCSEEVGCEIRTRLVDLDDERNVLTVTGNRATIVIRDDAEPLTAGEGCARLDEHSARCPRIAPFLVTRGGADVVRASVEVTVDLGAGDDAFAGGSGDDRVLGGAGRDRLSGGPGEDMFDPMETSRAHEPDVILGGPDLDIADYEMVDVPVDVDLARRRGPGGDALVGVEGVIGTIHADRLRGDSGENVLAGNGGRDLLDGRAGGDLLFGSSRSSFRCGGGLDQVVAPLRRRPRGCERLARSLP